MNLTRALARRALLAALPLLAAAPGHAGLPQPDHTLFGLATVDGRLVTTGNVTIAINDDPTVLVSYDIGRVAAFGERYVLRLPMDTAIDPANPGESRPPGVAREGDTARIYLDGALAGEVEVGPPGVAQRVDIDPSFGTPGRLTIHDANVLEGDAGVTLVEVEVELSRPLFEDVTVAYATSDGTATAGSDYTAVAGILTIPGGDVRGWIEVPVLGDVAVEPPEDFFVNLTNPAGAVIAAEKGRVVIEADDDRWVVSIADAEVLEGDGPGDEILRFVVTVDTGAPPEPSLTAGALPSGDVTVQWATENGTATAPADFVAANGSLTVATGVPCPIPGIALPCGTIEVAVRPDNQKEPTEDLGVQLSGLGGGAVFARDRAIGLIRNDEAFLHFVQARKDGDLCTGCLHGARAAAVSPDGANLYVGSELDSTLTVFARDPVDGRLETLVAVLKDNVGGVDGLGGVQAVAVSPDGTRVYAAGFLEAKLAELERDPGTGALTFLRTVAAPSGPTAIVASPDGAHLYVAGKSGNRIRVYDRATLAMLGEILDGVGAGKADGLLEPRGLAISPDGATLYAVSPVDATVVAMARNPSTGLLTYVGQARDSVGDPPVDGLDGAVSVAVSPDGNHVYVAGELDDAVAVFIRSPADGALTYRERKRNGLGGIVGLDGAAAVAVAPDGKHVYAASRWDEALVVFSRDAATGRLTFVEDRRDGDLDRNGPLDGLAGGLGLAQNADGRHIYVAGALDDGLAFFFRDLAAPPLPTVLTPNHVIGEWSNDPLLVATWSTTDDPLGVGLAGYSYLFDTSPTTAPDRVYELLHDPGVDPHSATTGPVGDHPAHAFHLRACDLADNCTAPVHVGPFKIDTVAPLAPLGLASPSHVPGEWSPLDGLQLTWTAPADPDPFGTSANSGVAGYELLIDELPGSDCTRSANLGEVTATTVPLPDGEWWAHLCAVDRADNWSPVVHAGPFRVDTVPPQVLGVSAVELPATGTILVGSVLHPPTRLLVELDSEVATPDDDAAWQLVGGGADGQVQTTGCDALLGDDTAIALRPPAYTAGLLTVALGPSGNHALAAGSYRLFGCAGSELADRAGNLLDGDGDGTGGDAFVLDFRVGSTNLLANPNFDADLAGWILSDLAGFAQEADDADGLDAFSGSARIDQPSGSTRTLSQCVALTGIGSLRVGFAARIASDAVDAPLVTAAISFFGSADCGADVLGSPALAPLAGDTEPDWIDLASAPLTPPGGALSARVTLISDAGTSTPSVSLDKAFVLTDETLFEDGFETGDTSAWSAAVGVQP